MTDYKELLISFYRKHKRMPVYREMLSLFGFKSKNAVAKVISKLIDAGIIAKDAEGHLTPSFSWSEVPLLGLVKAGVPATVDDVMQDTVSLDDFLIEKKDASFMLEVDGDSMIEAHIAQGDLVIAERTHTARDGDIVIAEVDGEWTMKYFKTKNGKTWLEPANKNYKPIYPERSLHVAAVVKGVIRKY